MTTSDDPIVIALHAHGMGQKCGLNTAREECQELARKWEGRRLSFCQADGDDNGTEEFLRGGGSALRDLDALLRKFIDRLS